MRRSQSFIGVAIGVAATLVASPAQAQLDPLLFLKNQPPNVILVVETTNRMQRDADLAYYDPFDYGVTTTWAPFLGLLPGEYSASGGKHHRKFVSLTHVVAGGSSPKYDAVHIDAVGNLEAGYASFYERTRLAVARRGLAQAVTDNILSARFSLIKTRQSLPSNPIPNTPNEDATVQDPAQSTNSGVITDTGSAKWKLTRPQLSSNAKNYTTAVQGPVIKIGDTNATSGIVATLNKSFTDTGGFMPVGADTKDDTDTPIGLMLEDAKTEAARLILADTSGCRNTVVVLVVGGGEGSVSGGTRVDLALKAQEFLNISGRRVPIYVVAIAPEAAYVTELRAVAANSGGTYTEVSKAEIEATLTGSFYSIGQPVPAVVRGVNRAIQHTFINSTSFNTAPTVALPAGPEEEFQVTSPIVGTVNLKGAQYYNKVTGALSTLPDSETEIMHLDEIVPQRSNVLVTSGFALPGFEGRLRALRVYKPVPDATQPSGYKFKQDGSRLWVASVPVAASRNIYTILPGTTATIKFDASNEAALTPYLRVNDPLTLINWVRSQPLGAVIGSTPAFLDPPSLDPPPDADYPGFRDTNKHRRALMFVGANDGMLHAIDSRTGVEVWAFIPFNLLPKLRALRGGQSLEAFKYFVDSSPKVADVKVSGSWRTFLFIGQGPGGTFYNALDVSLIGMEDTVEETAPVSEVLNFFSTVDRITRKWSFPRNSSFDATINVTAAPYGDLLAAASAEEKTVGETWSDPAIGQLVTNTGPYVMLVGSGFLKRSMETLPNRNSARAGRNFYVLEAATGTVLATRDIGADNFGESDDNCRTSNSCSKLKNALQMDPVATGIADSRYISRVYIGDLDGNVWRLDVAVTGTVVTLPAAVKLYAAGADQPMFASMATVNVGGTKQYIFVGTGSDLLPSNGVSSSYRMIVLLDTGASATLTAEILLEKTDGSLVGGDEKVTAFPAVAGDIVFFTTTTTLPGLVCAPFYANLYAFTYKGGPAYDTNNNGVFTVPPDETTSKNSKSAARRGGATTVDDDELVMSVAGKRATAPFIVDQHLVFSAGGNIEMFGDPDDFNNGVGQAGVRILSWRLIK